MRIDVSDIIKVNGASLKFSFNEKIKELNPEYENYIFDKPGSFEGQVDNLGGMLRLTGRLNLKYSVKCTRCLKIVERALDIGIDEDIYKSNAKIDEDVYFYEGDFLEIDDMLKDNIILNLPMKQLCNKECKGICPGCGKDLNFEECNCDQDKIDPRMEVLKKLLKNKD